MSKFVEEVLNNLEQKLKGASPYQGPTTPNNTARRMFKEFCKLNGYDTIGPASVYYDKKNNRFVGYSVCSSYVPECRQFGDFYDALTCVFPDGSMETYDRDKLNVGNITRVGADGTKYHNVKGLKGE